VYSYSSGILFLIAMPFHTDQIMKHICLLWYLHKSHHCVLHVGLILTMENNVLLKLDEYNRNYCSKFDKVFILDTAVILNSQD
jgi:hypothetical protein